jgi:hypothetical protein
LKQEDERKDVLSGQQAASASSCLESQIRVLGQQAVSSQVEVPTGQVGAIRAQPPPARMLARFDHWERGMRRASLGTSGVDVAVEMFRKEKRRRVEVENFIVLMNFFLSF